LIDNTPLDSAAVPVLVIVSMYRRSRTRETGTAT
jgi:hypothetical protein